jgi:uncharacterized protein YdeI (YjbR/CyaY-like superfamily)
MTNTDPKVDAYLSQPAKWHAEMTLLRQLTLDCLLDETFKWGNPCYQYKGTNIVIITPFKDYCALGFFKGALLADPDHQLASPGNQSQSMRQLRFTSPEQVTAATAKIKACIFEAIEIEKSGLKINRKSVEDYPVPTELQDKFNLLPELKSAFYALTPGRQRAYLLHFAEAKQSATRTARIEKHTDKILSGKGLND